MNSTFRNPAHRWATLLVGVWIWWNIANIRAADIVTNSIGMDFMRVEAGTFLMGAPADDSQADEDERPQHPVTIEQAFFMGQHEVTQQQYQRVMGENPSWFRRGGGGHEQVKTIDTKQLPVDMVSWYDAVKFCERLGQLTEETKTKRRYRLPTEIEWEFACRAGTKTRFAWGDNLTAEHAHVRFDAQGARRTLPIGSFAPNAWGLFDMHGNVWEWCADEYRYQAYQSSTEQQTPLADASAPKVIRGGDWQSTANSARSANRDFTRATRRDLGNGFRVVLESR